MIPKLAWKILLVDDDEDDYYLARQMLGMARDKEVQLQWASSFDAGCQALKSERFDAALVDYDLGAHNGLDLIRSLDPPNFPVPLVLLTGRGSFEVDFEAMQAGATLYLVKSEMTPLLLDRSIRYAIERKQAETELKRTRRELEERARQAEESQRLLQAMMQYIPEGITIASAPDVVTLATSRYADQILLPNENTPEGFSMPDWLAKVDHFLPDGVTPATVDDLPLTRAIKHGEVVEGQEMILRRPDGVLINVECNAGPIRDQDGAITAGIVAWRDITQRKQAEARSQQQSRLIEFSYEPIFIWDLDAGIVSWNQGCERLYGFTRGEAIGQASHELLKTRHLMGLADLIDTLRSQGAWSGELVQQTKDGRAIIVESHQELVETGGRRLVLETNRDITARKQAESELRAAHEQVEWMARFPEENPNPVVRVALGGAVLYANSPAQRLAGWKCEVGRQVDKIFAPLIALAAAQGSELSKDLPLNDNYYSVSVIPVLDKGYVNIYGRDVTRRKQAENGLAQSETRWATTLASIGDAVLSTGIDGCVTYLNPVAEELTGWTLAEARGKPVRDVFQIINEQTRQAMADPVSKVLESGAVVGLGNHTLLVRRDGREVPIDDSGAPIKDSSGEVTGVVLVFRNISDRRQKEAQFARLAGLYATLSHVNEAIVRAHDPLELCKEMCSIIAEGGFPLVWIGQVQEGRVEPVARCGAAAAYLDHIKVTVKGKFSKGPTGTAIREDRPVINPDFDTNPSTLPWRTAALQFGLRASAAFPLRRHGVPVGALTLYASDPSHFDPEQVALLEQLSVDISYALDALEQEQINVQSQVELRQSEVRYRSLFNGISEGFALHEIICDANGNPCDYRFLDINPAFERLTGLKRADVVGRTHNEVLPNDSPQWVEIYGKVALNGESVHFENYSPALKQHYEVFTYQPAPRQFAVLFMNITGRKGMEEQLRQSEEHYRSLFERMHEGLFLASCLYGEDGKAIDFIYHDVNPAFEKIMNRPRAEIVGHHAKELAPNLKQGWLELFEKAEKNGEAGSYSTYSIDLGQYYQSFAFRPAAGQFAVIVTDISERMKDEEALREADRQLKEYAQRLERSNRDLQEFASIASHDLQEPLRKVKGFSELLQGSLAGRLSDQDKDYFVRMVSASTRMKELIEALLAYSRVSTKAETPRTVDLGAVAAEVIAGMDAEIAHLGARVEAGSLPQIEADPLQMRQLLQNLLSNALKFQAPGATPLVQVGSLESAPPGYIRIYVKDNGIGFESVYLERIFRPFERLHGRGEFPGTGMGLAICQRIVERHRGVITAESVPGQGSTFIVTLPAKQTHSANSGGEPAGKGS